MIQTILVILAFAGALAYLGRMIYKSFQAKSCATGCGKCGIDMAKIEKQLKQKGI